MVEHNNSYTFYKKYPVFEIKDEYGARIGKVWVGIFKTPDKVSQYSETKLKKTVYRQIKIIIGLKFIIDDYNIIFVANTPRNNYYRKRDLKLITPGSEYSVTWETLESYDCKN